MEAKDDRSGCDNWSYKSCKVPVISLGDRKGIRPVKKTWVLVCWWWWFDWSFAWLMTYGSSSPVVNTTSIILCFNKHWLTQVHRENGRWNGERERERERERSHLTQCWLSSVRWCYCTQAEQCAILQAVCPPLAFSQSSQRWSELIITCSIKTVHAGALLLD